MFENLTEEELEEKIAWYENQGWQSNAEAAKARLNQLQEADKEELDIPEELGEEPPEGMEVAQLRCSSAGIEQ